LNIALPDTAEEEEEGADAGAGDNDDDDDDQIEQEDRGGKGLYEYEQDPTVQSGEQVLADVQVSLSNLKTLNMLTHILAHTSRTLKP